MKNPFNIQVGGTHYQKDGVMGPAEWCMKHELGIGEFNVIKYTFRHENKDGIKDLRKAKQYLKFIAWVKDGETI